MTTNFLYQLNQHYPHSYAITLSAAKFELGLLSQVSETLANLHPAIHPEHHVQPGDVDDCRRCGP